MGKFMEYSEKSTLAPDEYLLLDGDDGTHRISGSDLAATIVGSTAAIMHRNLFRGKNLGNVLTSAQKAAIKSGTFEDLYVGDYWIINNLTWRIVDIDYWYNERGLTTHHLVIMPDTSVSVSKMVDATADGILENVTPYLLSYLHTVSLPEIKETYVDAAFGRSSILTRKTVPFANKIESNTVTSISYGESTVEVPNEFMVFGTRVVSKPWEITGGIAYSEYDTNQLSGFRLNPTMLRTHPTADVWLRDVGSLGYRNALRYCTLSASGGASPVNANVEIGVRPVFGITGN